VIKSQELNLIFDNLGQFKGSAKSLKIDYEIKQKKKKRLEIIILTISQEMAKQ